MHPSEPFQMIRPESKLNLQKKPERRQNEGND